MSGEPRPRTCTGCGSASVKYKLDGRFFCEVCGSDDAIVNKGRSAGSRSSTAPKETDGSNDSAVGNEPAAHRSLSTTPRPSRRRRALLAIGILTTIAGVVLLLLLGPCSGRVTDETKPVASGGEASHGRCWSP